MTTVFEKPVAWWFWRVLPPDFCSMIINSWNIASNQLAKWNDRPMPLWTWQIWWYSWPLLIPCRQAELTSWQECQCDACAEQLSGAHLLGMYRGIEHATLSGKTGWIRRWLKDFLTLCEVSTRNTWSHMVQDGNANVSSCFFPIRGVLVRLGKLSPRQGLIRCDDFRFFSFASWLRRIHPPIRILGWVETGKLEMTPAFGKPGPPGAGQGRSFGHSAFEWLDLGMCQDSSCQNWMNMVKACKGQGSHFLYFTISNWFVLTCLKRSRL